MGEGRWHRCYRRRQKGGGIPSWIMGEGTMGWVVVLLMLAVFFFLFAGKGE